MEETSVFYPRPESSPHSDFDQIDGRLSNKKYSPNCKIAHYDPKNCNPCIAVQGEPETIYLNEFDTYTTDKTNFHKTLRYLISQDVTPVFQFINTDTGKTLKTSEGNLILTFNNSDITKIDDSRAFLYVKDERGYCFYQRINGTNKFRVFCPQDDNIKIETLDGSVSVIKNKWKNQEGRDKYYWKLLQL